MNRKIRMLFAAAAAAAMFAAAVGAASANNLSISSRNARVVWSALKLSNTAFTEQSLSCPVTLEGSFHSQTIRKVARALIGHVTRAAVANLVCTGGNATINQETLPWHLTYESFRGTLPRITEVTFLLVGASSIIRTASNTCRFTTTTSNNAASIANLNEATGQISNVRADETRRIPLTNGPGGIFCGLANGIFSGGATETELGNSSSVSLTLIGGGGGGNPSSLEPAAPNFGTVEPNEILRRTVTIQAGLEARVESIRVSSARYFAIVDPNDCVGTSLAERERCAFVVLFAAPSSSGRSVETTLSVTTNLETLRATVRGST